VRIAFVAPLVTAIAEPQLGGSQALLADIASGLAGRGHDVSVFAASGSDVDGVRTVDTGVDPAELASALFRAEDEQVDSVQMVDAFARVYGLIGEESFDLIHNHAFDAPAIELAPSDVPVVHTLHLPPRERIAAAIDASRVRSRSLTVAAVSRFGAASWERLVHIDVVLSNGVPVERIGFSSDGGRRALYAGRLSPEKGAAEAIEIAERAGVSIVVAGAPYDERYAAERIEPKRSASVELVGAVPRVELWRLMGESGVVLCPALWDEPFGLVAAEAQAAGTPVIAFARGALGEVVRDGETGAVVEDVAGAVQALEGIGSIERGACRRHAERNLDLARTLDAHEALYGRLAAPDVRMRMR
jgi:glycosyltransferase involved in cell wall biosynthesis